MSIRKLRQKKNLSQEELAENTGLSLRTIQRIESGDNVSTASWKILASFFDISIESLQENNRVMDLHDIVDKQQQRVAYHRAAQLIIFIVTFFVFVSQWMVYFADQSAAREGANLWTILSYLTQIAIAAAVFAYLFNHAKVTFVWSYYAITAAFLIFSIALGIWTEPYGASVSYGLLYPVYYSLMLLCLLIIHVLQMTLSLQGETAVLAQN